MPKQGAKMKIRLIENRNALKKNALINVPRRDALALLLLLAACDASPYPSFFGATQTRTTVEGRDFTVFQKLNKAEVVRLGWAGPQERRGMRERMILAAEQATGCTVNPTSFEGDDGEARMSLRCPK